MAKDPRLTRAGVTGFNKPKRLTGSKKSHIVVAKEGDKIKTIGNTNNGGQRFAEYLDEFRVYGIALTDFEVEKIYREAGGSLLAVGEGNYSVSVWVKPDSLLATPVYDFAFGWYEGGGGEYMQARMSQGDITDYNQLDYFNPGDTQQKTVLDGFVTERLFNGSFNDVQLDDIDYGHIAQINRMCIATTTLGIDIVITKSSNDRTV